VSTARTVARSTTRLLGGLLSAKVLDFVFYLILARRLGVEQFGRYTFAMSFTLLFSVIADFGVSTLIVRETSRAPRYTRALLGRGLVLKLGLALVTLLVTLGTSVATRSSPDVLALTAVFTVAMLLNSAALLFENLLKSGNRAGVAGMSVVAQSATALAVGVVLVFSRAGAMGGALAYLAAATVHLGVALVTSRDLWRAAAPDEAARDADSTAPPAPLLGYLALLREAAPLALSGVFIVVYFRIDSVLLHAIKGESAVGLYGGIYRFFEAFVLLSAAYRSVLFPIMARAADGPAQALGVLCRKSLRLHLMFTIGVAVFVTFRAREIIVLVLGPDYAPAAAGLAILIWALPGAFMADTMLHLLAAQRRQSVSARAVAITALFNVAINLTLIPYFSYLGASATTVASEALSFALMYMAFGRSVPRIGLFGVARAPLIAGGIAAATMVLLSPLDPGGAWGIALMGTFAMAAYILALVALGALGRQDAELVQEILPAALRASLRGERRT